MGFLVRNVSQAGNRLWVCDDLHVWIQILDAGQDIDNKINGHTRKTIWGPEDYFVCNEVMTIMRNGTCGRDQWMAKQLESSQHPCDTISGGDMLHTNHIFSCLEYADVLAINSSFFTKTVN